MHEHTKGKWENRESHDGGKTRSIIGTDEKGEWVIASVNLCMGKESETNARLISHSPELLRVLKNIISSSPLNNSLPLALEKDIQTAIYLINRIEKT